MQKAKRHILIINKAFQWKVIFRIYFALFLTVLFLSGLTYMMSDHYLDSDRVFDYFMTVHSMKDLLAPVILVSALSGLGLGILFVTISFIVVTHRIAGPIYHLRKNIESMAEGDLTVDPHTRAKDEFKGLARAVEKLLLKERGLVEGLRQDVLELERGEDLTPQKREVFNRIKGRLKDYQI